MSEIELGALGARGSAIICNRCDRAASDDVSPRARLAARVDQFPKSRDSLVRPRAATALF